MKWAAANTGEGGTLYVVDNRNPLALRSAFDSQELLSGLPVGFKGPSPPGKKRVK